MNKNAVSFMKEREEIGKHCSHIFILVLNTI